MKNAPCIYVQPPEATLFIRRSSWRGMHDVAFDSSRCQLVCENSFFPRFLLGSLANIDFLQLCIPIYVINMKPTVIGLVILTFLVLTAAKVSSCNGNGRSIFLQS